MLITQNPETGSPQLNVWKHGGKYVTVEEHSFGSYISTVRPEDLYRELGTSQIKALGEEPAWTSVPPLPDIPHFEISGTPPTVNRHHYIALTKLYRYFCTVTRNVTLEAHARMYLSPNNEVVFLVPKQTVTGGSVNFTSEDLTDILSGEKKTSEEWVLAGYKYIGLSHSHNTMRLNVPSSIDDTTEIPVAGVYFLHSCFANLEAGKPDYQLTVTFTTGSQRFITEQTWVEEYCPLLTQEEWQSSIEPAAVVYELIQQPQQYTYKYKTGSSGYYSPSTKKTNTLTVRKKTGFTTDPFLLGELENWAKEKGISLYDLSDLADELYATQYLNQKSSVLTNEEDFQWLM